jgi:hypothetical protein
MEDRDFLFVSGSDITIHPLRLLLSRMGRIFLSKPPAHFKGVDLKLRNTEALYVAVLVIME